MVKRRVGSIYANHDMRFVIECNAVCVLSLACSVGLVFATYRNRSENPMEHQPAAVALRDDRSARSTKIIVCLSTLTTFTYVLPTLFFLAENCPQYYRRIPNIPYRSYTLIKVTVNADDIIGRDDYAYDNGAGTIGLH